MQLYPFGFLVFLPNQTHHILVQSNITLQYYPVIKFIICAAGSSIQNSHHNENRIGNHRNDDSFFIFLPHLTNYFSHTLNLLQF